MTTKRSDCCNPSATRDEDRCIGCPMRTPKLPQGTAGADSPAPAPKVDKPQQPAARPEPRKSLWAFLNGEIPRE